MADRKILLVEGKDDEHVLKHICGNRGIPPLDRIIPHDGDIGLLESISTRLKAIDEEGAVLGVIIDADTSATNRWQSIRDRFIQAGYEDVPVQPDPDGAIFDPPAGSLLPRAGVWIMPDNQSPGILENFLTFLIPQPNALFDHANASVNSIPDRRFSQSDKPKAVIHTWLAWQEEPGMPFGTAITARFLDPGVLQADVLVSWLRELFLRTKK
jgi:hypothetical protein